MATNQRKHVKTRSPYFLQKASSEAGVNCELYIWTGNVTSDKPATPQYTLTKEVFDGAATFEVSELVRDFLSQTSALSSGYAWFSATLSDGASTDSTYTYLATEGFETYDSGLKHDGTNSIHQGVCLPLDSNGNARVTTATNSNGVIPVSFNSGTSTNYWAAFDSNGDLITTNSVTTGSSSTNQITNLTTNIAYSEVRLSLNSSNVLANSAFNTDTSSWQTYTGTLTWEASRAKTVGSGLGAGLRQSSILTVGTAYRVSMEVESNTLEEFEYYNGQSWVSLGAPAAINTPQTFVFSYIAKADYLLVRQLGASTTYWDNITALPLDDQTIYVDNLRCSEYEPIRLLYVNKYGAKNYFHFGLKSVENISASSETYRRSLVNYSSLTNGNSLHAVRKRITGSKQAFTLNTDWIDEYYVDQLEELLLSEYVWLVRTTGNPIPVNIQDSKIAKKTHLNDKLINYTMNVETASEYINVVR